MTYTLLIITGLMLLSPYQPLERVLKQMSPLHPCSRAANSVVVFLYLSLYGVVSGLVRRYHKKEKIKVNRNFLGSKAAIPACAHNQNTEEYLFLLILYYST